MSRRGKERRVRASDEVPEIMTIRFTPGIAAAIHNYARSMEITFSDAIRELVQMGLSHNPTDTMIMAARRSAAHEVRNYVATAYTTMMKAIAADMEQAFFSTKTELGPRRYEEPKR